MQFGRTERSERHGRQIIRVRIVVQLWLDHWLKIPA